VRKARAGVPTQLGLAWQPSHTDLARGDETSSLSLPSTSDLISGPVLQESTLLLHPHLQTFVGESPSPTQPRRPVWVQ